MKYFFTILSLFIINFATAQNKYTFDGNIENDDFYLDFAIYTIGDPIDATALETSFKEAFSEVKFSMAIPDQIEENTIAFWHYEDAQTDYPPMPLEYLKYFGQSLSDRQQQMLAKSKEAAVFTLYGPKKDAWQLNKKLTKFLADLTKDKQWIIFDYVTNEYFTPIAWETSRSQNWTSETPYLPAQITVHSYRDESLCRSITLGMQKFGLPDIVINNSSCYNQDAILLLISTLAQHLTVNKNIYKDQTLIDLDKISNKKLREEVLSTIEDNAKKKAILNFKKGKNEEGDPDNVLLEIDFENKNFDTPQLHQEQIISDLFGFSDEISYIDHNDEILKASLAAKANLPKLKKLFNSEKMEDGYTLLLKAPFEEDDGGTEWMWVEVTNWKTNQITGLLQNEPYHVKGLKAGSVVTVAQEDIFDFILYKPDGTQEGNETEKLILKAEGN